jgi:nucleoside-diphosphate-sugar epimerase
MPPQSQAHDLPMNHDYLSRLKQRLEHFPEPRRAGILAEEMRRREAQRARLPAEERKVLVIGGAGYIGSVVVPDLLEDGYGVVSADLLIYENAPLALTQWHHPRYAFHRLDLRNPASWAALLAGVSDVVILGALVGDPITKKYPVQSQQINVEALKQLLPMMDLAHINKVLFVSTCSNYGLQADNTPASEEAPLNPLSVYAKNKVEVELHLRSRPWTFHHTTLRFATAFGLSPRMRFDLTVSEFTRELFLGRELLVYDADTWRPYCHVRDLSRAVRRVLDYPVGAVGAQVFNTGGDGNNHTKRSIVELISAFVPQPKVAYKAHGSDPRNYRVNFSKIRQTLDFEPRYNVEDGVRELAGALQSGVFDDVEAHAAFHGNRVIAAFDGEKV